MIVGAHHIDFVVRDLEAAAARLGKILGIEPRGRESLPHRGVELIRFDLGNLWLIVVSPTRPDSPVQRFLDSHGEGFFHLALETADLAAETERLAAAGIETGPRRRGIEGWQLADVPAAVAFPADLQLIEEDPHGRRGSS